MQAALKGKGLILRYFLSTSDFKLLNTNINKTINSIISSVPVDLFLQYQNLISLLALGLVGFN
jgi:hypothetical protein